MKMASQTQRRQFPGGVICVAVARQFIPVRVSDGGTTPGRSRRALRMALAVACFSVWSVMFPAPRAEAGSLVVPAWSFARGNARVDADQRGRADASPVVGSGPEEPWGSVLEYDIDIPVTAEYTLQICYAAAEARPVEILFDGRALARCCTDVTFGSASSDQSAPLALNSSGAKWQSVHHEDGNPAKLKIAEGKHTLKITRGGPLPHLVALRLDTPEKFPEGWKPPQHTVRNLDSVPAGFRGAFSKVAALPPPVDDAPKPPGVGSLMIPAWTFERGNARVYASPDEYADGEPLVGGGPQQPEETAVEYDVDFPVTADYTLQIRYAAAAARPVDVWLDGRCVGKGCNGVTIDSRPTEFPVTFSSSARFTKWEGLYDYDKGKLLYLPVSKGKHTLKISRKGPLPNLAALRLDTPTAFPKDWKQLERKADLGRVPPRYRSAFLPPGAVNVAALRLAIQDTMATSGPQYPDGEQCLKQLSDLEAKQSAAASGTAEDKQKIEGELAVLRSRAMLTHPALKFDKLLFLKRPAAGYGHTYADQFANTMGGSLCILSPVAPDGKVTTLVPELDGGLFDRFDLSFDAKKVVFGYKKKDGTFRIYEIDIDPAAGKMVPGSLRQLTSSMANEAEVVKCNAISNPNRISVGFDDMDPCYLPDGRIIFVSTRSMRNVFCAGETVTNLYVMDADGKNMRCLSAGPINETSPSVLEDGRVIYTRWEYVDKGLGNGEGLWAVRPDGSGSDHVYKNNTVWPAGMSGARGIPGSQQIVTIGGGHHFTAVGTVVLVDTNRSRRTTEAMNCITPETGYPHSMGYPSTRFGVFMDPYPFSEKFFLVSHKLVVKDKGEARFGIHALDAWGNRAEIYQAPDLDCFEPMPLRPRHKPVEISSIVTTENPVSREPTAGTPAIAGDVPEDNKPASLFIQDIYQGMTGIERGRVKYVRVMGALPWPWNERGMVNVGVDVHRKKVYGVVKVHDDGSAHFNVPPNENLFFQALDEDFMSLQHMATFINLMPGEQRSCIGCHEPRKNAPGIVQARPMALNQPAQALAPQPGDTGPRMVHYPVDVQPVLDKHCVGCHSGKEPKGRLDLTEALIGNNSYNNLLSNRLVNYRACESGAAHFRAVPPLTHGSHRSLLVGQIRKDPCKANLTREEFIRIVTWIDANVPYYGTYRGKHGLEDKDDPDFRALPLVGK